MQSRRTHLRKASILRAVFHSLPDVDSTGMAALAFSAGMRRRAEALRAELKSVNDPGGLKRHDGRGGLDEALVMDSRTEV